MKAEKVNWILSKHEFGKFLEVIFILKHGTNNFKIRIKYASFSHHLILVIENSNDMV